jgi:hypothetical protein
MSFPIKTFNFNTHSYHYLFGNKIKRISSWILLLLLTNTHTECTGGAQIANPSPAISMEIPKPTLVGKNKTIGVKLMVPSTASLSDYKLCIKIDDGNNKSSVTYYNKQGKKQTFHSSKEIKLDQLIQPTTDGKYECTFELKPSKQTSQLRVIFELFSANGETQTSQEVTWHISELQVKVVTDKSKHYLEVECLSGAITTKELEQWRIILILLRGTEQVTFGIPGFETKISASLAELLPTTNQLEQGKPCRIPINVCCTREVAFMAIPVKVDHDQKADNKITLSPKAFELIAPHYVRSTDGNYAKGIRAGWERVFKGTTLEELEDAAYQRGLRMGEEMADKFNGGEWLIGLSIVGVGMAVIVAFPGPGWLIGGVMVPLGFFAMLDAIIPHMGRL